VMAIQTVEAWIHSVHRNFTDVIVFLVIGVVLITASASKTRGSRASRCVNERRNPTLCVDNRFFSSSFHGFSKGDDSVAQRLWGQIGVICSQRSRTYS
jgi:hypothetical protein